MCTELKRPRLAITLGDPAGVGPEVIALACASPKIHEFCRPIVVGDPGILARAARAFAPKLAIVSVDDLAMAESSPTALPCLPAGNSEIDVPLREVTAAGGQAAYDAVLVATRLALEGQVDGICTAPLSKSALWKAGHHYPGHTELIGELCSATDVAMMLYLPPSDVVAGPAGFGVVHATLHVSLSEALATLSEQRILACCQLAHTALADIKGSAPRLAVAALNPHAGEDGLFGDEERTKIGPAVAAAQAAGIDAIGPLPCDTLMVRGRAGEFDGAVAMYHDQGHIALKLLGMHRAVNVTLGLPIVRTSVAHGTAMDRAWRGEADYGGMIVALEVASHLARHRTKSP